MSHRELSSSGTFMICSNLNKHPAEHPGIEMEREMTKGYRGDAQERRKGRKDRER